MPALMSLLAEEITSTPGPLTTGAVFLGLTGAVTYLYRARDRDRQSYIDQLQQDNAELRRQLDRRRDIP